MHKLNVLLLGPTSFISTLNEIKKFLKFNPILDYTNNPNIILFHTHALQNKEQVTASILQTVRILPSRNGFSKQIMSWSENSLDEFA